MSFNGIQTILIWFDSRTTCSLNQWVEPIERISNSWFSRPTLYWFHSNISLSFEESLSPTLLGTICTKLWHEPLALPPSPATAPIHQTKSYYVTDGMALDYILPRAQRTLESAVGYFCEIKSVNLATPSSLLTVKNVYTKLTLIDVCVWVHNSIHCLSFCFLHYYYIAYIVSDLCKIHIILKIAYWI